MLNRISFKTRLAAFSLAALFGASAHATDITGAGSTFVYPVLSKWSAAYSTQTGNHVNYQSIGSGAGIAQIKAGTVDFGASDKTACRSATTASSCSVATASSRSTRSNGGTATCVPSA